MATTNKKSGQPDVTGGQQGIEKEQLTQFPLVKINFILMAIAALMIVIGFALTAGGASDDPSKFSDEIFSFRHIVLGPNIAFLGFIFMGVGIMWPSKKKNPHSDKQ